MSKNQTHFFYNKLTNIKIIDNVYYTKLIFIEKKRLFDINRILNFYKIYFMKRYIFILLFFVWIISWCSFSERSDIDITFPDATNKFALDMSEFYLNTLSFVNKTNYSNNIICNFAWWDKNFVLNSSIDFSWYTNSWNDFYQDSLFSIYFKDTSKSEWNKFEWSIILEKANEEYFFNLKTWHVDFGTWNYEWEFINLLASNLWWKWIKYDPENIENVKQISKKIISTLQILRYANLLNNISETKYEWNLAYKVVSDDVFKPDFDIKWDLLVKWKEKVELKIDDSVLYIWQNNYFIKWNIGGDYWTISVKESQDTINYLQIDRYIKKWSLYITISNIANFDTLWDIDIVIKNFLDNNKENRHYNIEWDINISPKLIYWSNLENNVKININCFYEKNTLTWNYTVREPESYILLDQILGDNFSLKSILDK